MTSMKDPRIKWFQFRLRTLLFAIVLASVFLSWDRYVLRPEREAVSRIYAAGGFVRRSESRSWQLRRPVEEIFLPLSKWNDIEPSDIEIFPALKKMTLMAIPQKRPWEGIRGCTHEITGEDIERHVADLRLASECRTNSGRR
jgi:hypothetical protein